MLIETIQSTGRPMGSRRIGAGSVAFLSLFAAQSGLLALSPILPSVAQDFGVSTATAGQLRALVGLAGGMAAVTVVLFGRRVGLRRLLLAGNGLLVLGALASAAAPTIAALAAAQVAIGGATGLLISGGLAAAATWPPPDRRPATIAWASLGQPASWVVGMPLIGASAGFGWRYAFLSVPLAAGLAGLAAVGVTPRQHHAGAPAQRAYRIRWDAKLFGWAAGELLSYAAWGGTLVYAGALLVESYHAGAGAVGLLLGAAAMAAFPGNLLVRRWLGGSSRELLVALGLGAAAITALFGTLRPGLITSAAIFTALVLVATARTVAGSTFALYVTPERRLATMGIRASTGQFGYLVGAGIGGAALAAGGYPLLGITLAALFVGGAAPHIAAVAAERWTPAPERTHRLRQVATARA